ncbi:MAG: hypothetical protein AAEJ65_02160, partial [Planctomycetota bacterium]
STIPLLSLTAISARLTARNCRSSVVSGGIDGEPFRWSRSLQEPDQFKGVVLVLASPGTFSGRSGVETQILARFPVMV